MIRMIRMTAATIESSTWPNPRAVGVLSRVSEEKGEEEELRWVCE